MPDEDAGDEGASTRLPALPASVINAALHPAASEFGETIKPVGKVLGRAVLTTAQTINLMLAPCAAVVWGAEQIRDWLNRDIAGKLEDVPPEKICQPDARVAVPAIEALRYVGPEKEISDLFANILASAMNVDTRETVHPAFVEIVKQMGLLDAKIIKYLRDESPSPYINLRAMQADGGGYQVAAPYFGDMWTRVGNPKVQMYSTSIENLIRLELMRTTPGVFLVNFDYEELQNHASIAGLVEHISNAGSVPSFDKRIFEITELGSSFCSVACPAEKDRNDRGELSGGPLTS